MTVIVWLATVSEELVNVACAEPLSATLAESVVLPSRKLTVPAGVPAPGLTAVTVAVKVTGCPKTEEMGDDARLTALDAWLTVSPKAADVLLLKLPSPPKVPVMEWLPVASVEVLNVAWPVPFTAPVPNVAAPSKKVTVPVAVPMAGGVAVTVAVKVTT